MKKILFCLLTFVSISVQAQDSIVCLSCIKKTYDAEYKTTYIHTKKLLISHDQGKTGFIFEMDLGNESVIFSVKTLGAGNCIKEKNVMRIVFVDSVLIGVISSEKFNCTGMSTFSFSKYQDNLDDLEMLQNKLIKSIYVETEEGSMKRRLTPQEAKQFQQYLKCLMRYKVN